MISSFLKKAQLVAKSIGSSFEAAREIEAMVRIDRPSSEAECLKAAREILQRRNKSLPQTNAIVRSDAKVLVEECVKHAREELNLAEAALSDQILHYPAGPKKTDRKFRRLLSEHTRVKMALSALQPQIRSPTGAHL